MPYNPVTDSAALVALRANIAQLAMDNFEETPDYKQIVREIPINESFAKDFQRFQTMVGFGAAKEWQDGSSAESDSVSFGPYKDLFAVEYAIQTTFERKLPKLQKYDVMGKIGAQGGYSLNLALNQLAAIIADNGTATTYHKDAEGVALLSASRVTHGEGAASWNNIISSNAALSYAALQDLFVVAQSVTNLRGHPLPRYIPVRVMVTPTKMNTIKALIKNPAQHGTTDRNISTFFNELTYDVNRYMTQSNYWYAFAKDWNIVIGFLQKFRTKVWTNDDTESIKYRADMWFLHGLMDQVYGVYGSTGAA